MDRKLFFALSFGHLSPLLNEMKQSVRVSTAFSVLWLFLSVSCLLCYFLLLLYITFSFSFLSDCKFTLLQDSGTFQTPNFPLKYPNNIECVWNIQVQPGRFILLSFDVVELESYRGECIDLVEVKDGDSSTDQLLGKKIPTLYLEVQESYEQSLLQQILAIKGTKTGYVKCTLFFLFSDSFCDISLAHKVITSSSNTLRIWFYSDKSDAYQGFNGSYISQWEKGE